METELRYAKEERAEYAALGDCVLALEAGALEELGLGVVEHSELGVEGGPRAAEGAPELATAVLAKQVEVQGAELVGVGARHAALKRTEALVQLELEALLSAS